MKKLFFAFLLCSVLAGCGVKPGSVKPPEGSDPDAFPHTYPNPATDPAP